MMQRGLLVICLLAMCCMSFVSGQETNLRTRELEDRTLFEKEEASLWGRLLDSHESMSGGEPPEGKKGKKEGKKGKKEGKKEGKGKGGKKDGKGKGGKKDGKGKGGKKEGKGKGGKKDGKGKGGKKRELLTVV